jgi:hypothetical protein
MDAIVRDQQRDSPTMDGTIADPHAAHGAPPA